VNAIGACRILSQRFARERGTWPQLAWATGRRQDKRLGAVARQALAAPRLPARRRSVGVPRCGQTSIKAMRSLALEPRRCAS